MALQALSRSRRHEPDSIDMDYCAKPLFWRLEKNKICTKECCVIDYLYKKSCCKQKEPIADDVHVFHPSPLNPFLPNEQRSFSLFAVRLYFWIITRGKIEIYFMSDKNGALMHSSVVLGKCYKFPFMESDDFEIGPCRTYPQYRRRGLYKKVLNYITSVKLGGGRPLCL